MMIECIVIESIMKILMILIFLNGKMDINISKIMKNIFRSYLGVIFSQKII